MKKVKKILATTATVGLLTTATLNIVACDNYSLPQLDSKYAKLLEWYDVNEKSLIKQKLNYNFEQKKYSIIADDSLIKISNIFKNKLLTTNGTATSDKYKANSIDSSNFLSDLGFKSGDAFKPYSEQEYHKIDQLTVRVENSFSGKINEKYTEDGFEVEEGTCQIDIINNSEILKSYIIKTKNNNNLKILDKPTDLGTNIIFYEKNKKSIKRRTKVSDFKLKFKGDKQEQWDALIIFLNTKVYTFFYDSPQNGNKINNFNDYSDQVYLQIDFGKINILNYRIGPISIID